MKDIAKNKKGVVDSETEGDFNNFNQNSFNKDFKN